MAAQDALHVHARDPRVEAGLCAETARQYARRSGLALGVGLTAGLLALWALGARAWDTHLLWAAAMAVAVALRFWAARGVAPATDDAAARRLTWLRAAALLQAAVWGGLAWAGPAPSTAHELTALLLIQGGVAIGGSLLALDDRRVALGFAVLVAVPLALRLVAGAEASRETAAITGGMLALLLSCLWLVGTRSERERRAMLVARLGQSLQAAQASDAYRLLGHVFGHLDEGVCIFGADGRLRAANARAGELLGATPDLLTPGTPLERWVRHLAAGGQYGAVDVDAEVVRRLADLSRPVPSVARRRRPDGGTIETRRTPLPEGGFAMVCADISDRLASEAALFENRRTLDVLLQQTEEGFWFIDNAHRTTDANPAMCRMLGLTRDALIGRTIWDFVDAENEAIFRAQVARREEGRATTYEITLTRADGTRVVCVNNATPIQDAQGRKIGAIGLFSDVTAERAAAATARAAMALAGEKSRVLALTLDSLSQGVLGFDGQQRLNSWNQRAMELLDLPPDLLAGQPTLAGIGRWQQAHGDLGEALDAIEDERMREIVRRNIGDDGAPGLDPPRYRRRRRDGRVIEVCIHRGSEGGQVRTYTDVTDEVLAARALMAARDEAERANRAKSEFLSRMSHELRTPLNAILGFGQLMQADAAEPLGAQQRQRLKQLLHGGQHLLSLINEVLDLAQIETGSLALTPAAVDADAVADACLGLVAPVAAQRAVRLLPREGGAGTVHADAMRLRQVLLNLLANAIKYNHRGGEVQLRAQAIAQAGAPWMRIEVHDTGPGLDEAQQARLFQPFERLGADRDAVEGTGIGLALSRSLVEAMAGRIGVRSTPGQGSCFWIELPCCPAAQRVEPPVPQPTRAPDAATVRRRVLYVEDNAVNQMVMQGMLSQRPEIELVLAASADEGLALAQQTQPELVLMDIQLPGASGYEVLRALRERPALRTVPVLAVSANALPADLERAREAGFADYLTKPLDLQALLAALDRWLAAPQA